MLVACRSNNVYDKLNGNWTNKGLGFNITINTSQNNYYGTSKGKSFTGTFSVAREENNTITLKVGKQLVLATVNSDRDLTLQVGKDNKPVKLQKVE